MRRCLCGLVAGAEVTAVGWTISLLMTAASSGLLLVAVPAAGGIDNRTSASTLQEEPQ